MPVVAASQIQQTSKDAVNDYQMSLIAAVMCAIAVVAAVAIGSGTASVTEVVKKLASGDLMGVQVGGAIVAAAIIVALGMSADMWARNTVSNSTGDKDHLHRDLVWSATILLGVALVLSMLPLAESVGGQRLYVMVGGGTLATLCVVAAGAIMATIASAISMTPVSHAAQLLATQIA